MGLWGGPSRKLRGGLAAALALAALAALPACASPSSYAGISLKPGAADPEIQALALRAQAGDKQAQLELGMLYEEGLRLPRDLDRARTLYKAAASDTGGTNYVYAPPVSGDGPGQLIHIPAVAGRRGLDEARLRLEALRARLRESRR